MSLVNNPTLKKYSIRGQVFSVYKVVQWKDGCVFKTKNLGFVVARSGQSPVTTEGVLSSVDTKYTRLWEGM